MFLCAALAVAGCRIEKTGSVDDVSKTRNPSGPNPVKVFGEQILPDLVQHAAPLTQQRKAFAVDPEAARRQYGRPLAGGTLFATRFEGKIVAADLEGRAGSVDVDADGDGQPDARVQIGPFLSGTALRDAQAFVSFGDFGDQVAFARFGRALNDQVFQTQLSALPRTDLISRRVEVLGVYRPEPGVLPLVTPARISVSS
jgi:predicted lipoprotein